MTKKTTRTRAEAKRLMWEYYRDNREKLPSWIREYREEILGALESGRLVHECYVSIIRTENGTVRCDSIN